MRTVRLGVLVVCDFREKDLYYLGGVPLFLHVVRQALSLDPLCVLVDVVNGQQQGKTFPDSFPENVFFVQNRDSIAQRLEAASIEVLFVIKSSVPIIRGIFLKESLVFHVDAPPSSVVLLGQENKVLNLAENMPLPPSELNFQSLKGEVGAVLLQKEVFLSLEEEKLLSIPALLDCLQHRASLFYYRCDQSMVAVQDARSLIDVARLYQESCREAFIQQGVCLVAPETVFFGYNNVIAKGVVIHPSVVLGPNVTLREGVCIYSFSFLEDATIDRFSHIGPFARMTKNVKVGTESVIGNFVELKNSVVGDRVKIKHLAYSGDAWIGSESNIGAGTIVCNYDGIEKYHTLIEEGCFIGSNATLIAPLRVGAESFVAAGTVLDQDVPKGSVAFGRAKQRLISGGAKRMQSIRASNKKKDIEVTRCDNSET